MTDIQNFLNGFFTSTEWATFFAIAVAYLTSNLGAIILFAIKYIKLKATQTKNEATNQDVLESLNKKYNEKIDAMYKDFANKLDKLNTNVIAKMDTEEANKKAAISEQSTELQKTIETIKKAVSK